MPSISAQRRILVADDDPDIRQLINLHMRKRHISVEVADRGDTALRKLEAGTYHGLITDLRMPGMHGHELAMRALQMGEPRCVIVVTGLREPKIVSDLIARGVDAFELKPLDFPVLAAMTEAIIERKYRGPASLGGGADDVTSSLDKTVGLLRSQLSSVEQDFDRSIQRLEREKKNLQQEFFDTVQVFSKMMSQTGQFSSSHASRVEQMAAHIGEHAGMSAVELRHLRLAAMMHDIGQFGMPDSVVTKPPHAMTEQELDTFKKYPGLGAMLLKQTPNGGAIAQLIEHHRENFDGTGFPHGLAGERIPLGARVIRIADSIDNLVSHTEANKKQAALTHLHRRSGSKYDPELAEVAKNYVSESDEFDAADSLAVDAGELKPGMVLAEHAYDRDGRFLAREGTELTESLIRRLSDIVQGKPVKVLQEGGERGADEEKPND